MKLIQPTVKHIVIERGEGAHAECVTRTVATLADADALLRQWSRTAPQGGGYHKCCFTITFDDGQTYSGRFDLVHYRDADPDLQAHVLAHLRFCTGTGRPRHMTEESYAHYLALDHIAAARPALAEFLATYAAALGAA